MKRISTFGAILFVSLLSSPSWSAALEAAAYMDAVVERYWWYEFERTTSYFGAQVGVIGAIALSVIVLWLSKTIKTLSKHFRSKREHERVIIDRELRIKDTVTKNVSNIASKTADAAEISDGTHQRVFSRGFLFSEEKKLSLIRELLGQRIKQRMRMDGFDGMEYQLEVEKLGDLALIGSPEGTILAIVEDAIKMHKQGTQLSNILGLIEHSRKDQGHIESEFIEILRVANKPLQPNPCINMYCKYRMAIEQNSVMTTSEVDDAIEKASIEIMKW